MTDSDPEKFIAEQFARLPRKPVVSGHKETVWLNIQNELRSIRTAAPQTQSRGFFLRHKFNRYSVTALIVVVGGSVVGGTAFAAQSSLPGETLYGVKIATEKVQVVLATSDEQKVKILSTHAKKRLNEVTKLVEAKQPGAVVTQTLEALKNTTDKVVAVTTEKPELAEHAEALAAEEKQVLATVAPQAEGEAREAVEQALSQLENTDTSVGEPAEVKGTQTASSTAPARTGTAKKIGKPLPKPILTLPGEGYLESPIQIGGVINGDDGETVEPIQP
ncbi:MAG: hypothetical protein HY398_02215 [Candidatus Doudnabacteria bacterium]|nr:hypothetical protein [Candidatus Doudnabacteria bacterium]